MDGFFPAFVAALLAECGDKTQWLALALAHHFRRVALVLAGIAVAAFANAALAALGGTLLAPMLTPEAAKLMLALALCFAGVGALMRQTPSLPLRATRLSPFIVSFFSFFVLELGDKTQFLTFAISLRADAFWPTIAGATAGVVLTSAAVALASKAFERLPLTTIRRCTGALFLVSGLWTAISALRLI